MSRHRSACVLSAVCLAFISSVFCSSIITKDMIRMSNVQPPLFQESASATRVFAPEKLTMNFEDTAYHQVFPPNHQETEDSSTHSISLISPSISSTFKMDSLPFSSNSTPQTSTANITSSTQNQNRTREDYPLKQAWYTSMHDPYINNNYYHENSSRSLEQITSEDLSKRYWGQYQNLSINLLNSSHFRNPTGSELLEVKGFQDSNVLGFLQRIFQCPWSLGIFTCIRESFKDHPETIFDDFRLHYPRFNQEEDTFNPDYDIQGSDIDEGRRKLSKKLQMLLPILMMLKMTMLPALAVMALVSGKAFLISLLSLGVALVAASTHPSVLSASKRHEIAPQAPTPPDQLHSNYYYVM